MVLDINQNHFFLKRWLYQSYNTLAVLGNMKKIFYFFFAIFIFINGTCLSANIETGEKYEYTDINDFRYKVILSLKTDQNVLSAIYGIISGSEIEEEIKSLRTFSEESKAVSNMRTLNDRINADISIMYKKTHNMGFYASEIKYSIDIQNKKYVIVKININTGKLFKLKLNTHYLNQDEAFNKKYSNLLHKKLSNYSSSLMDIKQLIKEAIQDLESRGYYCPEILEKKIRLNYKTHEAILNLTIDPGQSGIFHFTEINAFPGISEKFIRNRIAWEEGDIFDITKIKQTKSELRGTQIFSDVHIKPIKEKIVNDKVPISIKLEEDKKHTIDFSLLYSGLRNNNYEKSSSKNKQLKSIIARLSWTRNNTFGNGEKLRFLVEGTPTKVNDKRSDYAFEVYLTQSDIFLKNMYVEYLCTKRQELTNIFFKKNDKISVMLNYPIWIFAEIRTGCSFEKNYINGNDLFFQEPNNNKRYESITIPLECILDNTDNLLNPTKGYRTSLKFHHINFKHANVQNLQYLDLNFAYNYSLDDSKRTIFAINLSRKFLIGKNIDDIPLDKRIYAGGMNSVRGYASQLASEKILNSNTHMGGKSSVEFNTEIRRKLSQDFGGVVFFDGAKIFGNKSKFKNSQTEIKRWFLSYGIGIRYFTSIGPIRIDFAFPIKRRKGIDSKMQFIISLGQAF